MKKNSWKNREGIVFSTDRNFSYTHQNEEEPGTLSAGQQQLRVSLDNSGRAGKQVTLISGFMGKKSDLEELAKKLKTKCGTGGSVKESEILIQGDVRDKVVDILVKEGYKARRSG